MGCGCSSSKHVREADPEVHEKQSAQGVPAVPLASTDAEVAEEAKLGQRQAENAGSGHDQGVDEIEQQKQATYMYPATESNAPPALAVERVTPFWVTVQMAGCFELRNWTNSSGQSQFKEILTKVGSGYEVSTEQENQVVEHLRPIIFDNTKLKPFTERLKLHTSGSRLSDILLANQLKSSAGKALQDLLQRKEPVAKNESHPISVCDALLQCCCKYTHCNHPSESQVQLLRCCQACRCVLEGSFIFLDSAGSTRIQVASEQRKQESNTDGSQGPAAETRGESMAWITDWKAPFGMPAAASAHEGQLLTRPLWAWYMAKYAIGVEDVARPALRRVKCRSCSRHLPVSKFCFADLQQEGGWRCAECKVESRGSDDRGGPDGRGEEEVAASEQGAGARVRGRKKSEELRTLVRVNAVPEAWERHLEVLKERVAHRHEVTVFLSSPFQGLLHERAVLVGRLLPQLTALCESRGVSLRTVDLRWGITTAMTTMNQTVYTCLEAMEDSDIFVGFYAQRYGSSLLVPGAANWMLPSLQACYADFPWVKNLPPVSQTDGETTTKSVTHLEFEAGFNDAHRVGGSVCAEGARGPVVAYAFFRDEEYDAEQRRREPEAAWKYRAENEESAAMLQLLKDETEGWARRGRGAVYAYSEPSEFAQRALADLEKLLRRVLPAAAADEEEDAVQASHLQVLTQAYTPVPAIEMELWDYIASDVAVPVCVTGLPGSGKSAVLARVVCSHQALPDHACAFHFVGVNSRSTQLEYVLERLIIQVGEATATTELRTAEMVAVRLPLVEQFGWVLDRWRASESAAQGSTLCIVLDALNELEDEPVEDDCSAHDLTWLLRWCKPLPPRVKVLVSSLGKCREYATGQTLAALERGGCVVSRLKPVRVEDCRSMVDNLLRQSYKRLDERLAVLPVLTSTPSRANPLFITLFVSELVCFNGYQVSKGVFQQLSSYFEELRCAEDAAQLLHVVVRRLETLHTAPDLETPVALGRLIAAEPDAHTPSAPPNSPPSAASRQLLRVRFEAKTAHPVSAEPGSWILLPGCTEPSLVLSALGPDQVQVDGGGGGGGTGASGDVMLVKPSMVAWVMKLIWASKEGLRPMELLDVLNLVLHEAQLRLSLAADDDDESAAAGRKQGGRVHLGAVVELPGGRTGTVTGLGKVARVSRAGRSDVWVLRSRLKVVSRCGGVFGQAHLTPLLASMHRMLAKSSGLVYFGHDYVRQAVLSRYLAFTHSGVAHVSPLQHRQAAEAHVASLHATMAEFFKERAEREEGTALIELPRVVRAKQHHEALSGRPSSLMVVARVRPARARGRGVGAGRDFVLVKKKQICHVCPRTLQPRAVTLDCCLSQAEGQQDVWRRCGGPDLVERVVQGHDVTLLAYGQTGSGKTHTMFGPSAASLSAGVREEGGLVPRLVVQLMQRLQKRREEHEEASCAVSLSVLEVYMDSGRDLLAPTKTAVRVVQGSKGGEVPGLTARAVATSKEAMAVIQEAYERRQVAGTAMNDASSRSHCIVVVRVEQATGDGAQHKRLVSRVNLVDLAGSEGGRTRKQARDFYQERGQREAEAISINKSLAVLNKVIAGLAAGRRHVPYKESTLTQILAPSLRGTGLTVLVVTVSPSPADHAETVSSLLYAREAKKIMNRAAENAEEELEEAALLERGRAHPGNGIVKELSVPSTRVKAIQLHPHKPWVLCCLHSGKVSVWDRERKAEVWVSEDASLPVRCGVFVPQKPWVVCAGDDLNIRVLHGDTGEVLHKFEAHMDYIRAIALHPEHPWVLSCSDDMSIKLWDWEQEWQCVRTFQGHFHYVMQLSIHPRDPQLFASGGLDQTILVWNVHSGASVRTLAGHGRGINAVSFIVDRGSVLLLSGDDERSVKVWSTEGDWPCLHTVQDHTGNISALAYLGRMGGVCSAAEDKTVRVYRASTLKALHVLDYEMGRVWCLAAHPSGDLLAVGCDEGFLVLRFGSSESQHSDNT